MNGSIDYSLAFLSYARHSGKNTLQNGLQADIDADLIQNRLKLASSASISRTAVSAFGVQPGILDDANSNTVEVRSLRVAPTLVGPIGNALRYTIGVDLSVADASGGSVGDATGSSIQLRLEPSRSSVLGWSLDASHVTTEYKVGRSSTSTRLGAGLRYAIAEMDLQFSAAGGAERTNLESASGRGTSNWSVGANWTPSRVTRVSADFSKRFFGHSHTLGIEYRTPRTLWQVRSSRTLSGGGSGGSNVRGAIYDLLFAQLAALQPDPLLRQALVLQTLEDRGIDPKQDVSVGFLQSAVSVQESLVLSAAWTSPRNTATVSMSKGKSRRVDSVASVADDLSGGNRVLASGLSINLSHRLTPLSSSSLVFSQQRSNGSVSGQSSRQDQIALQYNTRLTIDSTLGATLRNVRIHNDTQSYGESALTVTFGLRF